MKLKTLAFAALLSALPFAASAMSDMTMHGKLHLTKAWARSTPKAAPTGGGYLTIENTGTADDRLVSASSPAAKRVEVHRMWMDGDVMRMKELENGLPLPAGKSVELKPGGYHLMFMRIEKPFLVGETVKVTLTFEKAGPVTLDLPVKKFDRKKMSMGHEHKASE